MCFIRSRPRVYRELATLVGVKQWVDRVNDGYWQLCWLAKEKAQM